MHLMMIALLCSAISQSIIGILQLIGVQHSYSQDYNLTGTFFNPGPYGGYISSVFPVSLGLYLQRNQLAGLMIEKSTLKMNGVTLKIEKLVTEIRYSNAAKFIAFQFLPTTALFLMLAVLPSTRSRAAEMAAIFSSIYLLWTQYPQNKIASIFRQHPKLTVGGILILLISVLALAYTSKTNSADGRILIWKVSGTILKDHIITGTGYDNFKAHVMNYQAQYFEANSDSAFQSLADNVRYSFNEPLKFVVENGIIGCLLLVSVVIIFIYDLRNRNDNTFSILSKAGLLSIFIFSLVSYPAEILAIKINFVLFMALVMKNQAVYSKEVDLSLGLLTTLIRFRITRIILFSGALILCIYFVPRIYVYRDALRTWNQALDFSTTGLNIEAVSRFQSIEQVFNTDGDYLASYGKVLNASGKHAEAITILETSMRVINTYSNELTLASSYQATGNYAKAELHLRKAHFMIPSRHYPLFLLVNLFKATNKHHEAIGVAKELLAKQVKVNSKAIVQMRSEMLRFVSDSAAVQKPD